MKSAALFLALLIAPMAAIAAVPGEDPTGRYDGFSVNGFRLNAIEYWGQGNYAGGNGVSFGYTTNDKAWNQACARTAWIELKRILTLNTPEMKALREARGPTGIYIIISDWSRLTDQPDEQMEKGEVWHYNGDDIGRGGLIKFHGHARLSNDGATFLCSSPTEADLIAFAVETKARIDAGGNGLQ